MKATEAGLESPGVAFLYWVPHGERVFHWMQIVRVLPDAHEFFDARPKPAATTAQFDGRFSVPFPQLLKALSDWAKEEEVHQQENQTLRPVAACRPEARPSAELPSILPLVPKSARSR